MTKNLCNILEALQTTYEDNYINITDDIKIEFTKENVVKLFNYMSMFTITSRCKSMIVLYYGLGDLDSMTYEEIGKLFKVSDECVRSTINQGFRKMCHRLNKSRSITRFVEEELKS